MPVNILENAANVIKQRLQSPGWRSLDSFSPFHRIIKHNYTMRYGWYHMYGSGGGWMNICVWAGVWWWGECSFTWNGCLWARACPNILSTPILTAGLEAPATKTKAGLKPDEWMNEVPLTTRSTPFHVPTSSSSSIFLTDGGPCLRADVMSQFKGMTRRCENKNEMRAVVGDTWWSTH